MQQMGRAPEENGQFCIGGRFDQQNGAYPGHGEFFRVREPQLEEGASRQHL